MATYKRIKGKYESSHTSPYLGLECSCFSASAGEHCTPRWAFIIRPDPIQLQEEALCFSFVFCLLIHRRPFPPFISRENDAWGVVEWMMRPDIEKLFHLNPSVPIGTLWVEGEKHFRPSPSKFFRFRAKCFGQDVPKHNASLCRLPVVLP